MDTRRNRAAWRHLAEDRLRHALDDRGRESAPLRAWSESAARLAEECEACRRLLLTVIHQALMDTKMNPTAVNRRTISSAFEFLFDTQSRYFELLGLEQKTFCEQLVRRMHDPTTHEDGFYREEKARFLANYATYHMYSPVKGFAQTEAAASFPQSAHIKRI